MRPHLPTWRAAAQHPRSPTLALPAAWPLLSAAPAHVEGTFAGWSLSRAVSVPGKFSQPGTGTSILALVLGPAVAVIHFAADSSGRLLQASMTMPSGCIIIPRPTHNLEATSIGIEFALTQASIIADSSWHGSRLSEATSPMPSFGVRVTCTQMLVFRDREPAWL